MNCVAFYTFASRIYYSFNRKAVDNGNSDNMNDPIYSNRVRAGKRRTYFFDVRKTKGDDYFVTLTESTRRNDDNGFNRHKIFLYKEDFNRFLAALEDSIDHIKTELMPDYDYAEFDKKHAEYDKQKELEEEGEGTDNDQSSSSSIESEDDMTW